MEGTVMVAIMLLFNSIDSQSSSLPSIDEIVDTSSFLVQYCNNFCENNTMQQIVEVQFITSPSCLVCQCDSQCPLYGDCCPDANGTIPRAGNPPTCLYSDRDFDVQAKYSFGVFMVTACSKPVSEEFSPVYSVSLNMSFFNKDIAACNNVTDVTSWNLEIDCSSGDGSGQNEAGDLELNGVHDDEEENCLQRYSATRETNPRLCHSMLSKTARITECNVTGIWTEYRKNIEEGCRNFNYPVTTEDNVFQNVFCAICNGVSLNRYPFLTLSSRYLPPPITTITQFSRPYETTEPDEQCKDNEWFDPVRDVCIRLHCSSGKRLLDGDCVWLNGDVTGDEYTFSVLLKPENKVAVDSLNHWNSVQQMFVVNFEHFMSRFAVTNYMFAVGLIENMDDFNEQGIYHFSRGVIISCNLIITKMTNRTVLETDLYNFVTGSWMLHFGDHDHEFSAMFNTIPLNKVTLRATYWAEPVSGSCCQPVAEQFRLRDQNGDISSRVITVNNELFCPYVKFPKSEYQSDTSGWIMINNTNIMLSDFSMDDKKRVLICLDVLNDIYNGTYRNSSFNSAHLTSVYVQQILSFVCVTLSLVCLAMTLITYCAFPALRSLPAKNNMFLMGTLFLAQLSFQVGIDKTYNKTLCQIIGVLIHFLWLSVIFWMNVCSFHMICVFATNATAPQSRTNHKAILLKYSAYSFGMSTLIVVATLATKLVLSGGTESGYGGVVCYLSSQKLVGFSFVLPMCIVIMMNVTFFVVTARAISKIEHVQNHCAAGERKNVYIYIKLSTLTGMFWILAILAEVFNQEVLVYISIIANGSLGVLLFVCFTANARVLKLWKTSCNKFKPVQSSNDQKPVTMSTSL